MFYEAQAHDFYGEGSVGSSSGVAVTVRATSAFYAHIVPAVLLSGLTSASCLVMIYDMLTC